MVVALRAGDRQAEPGGRGALDAVEEADEALFLGDVAAFAVEDVVPVEGRGDLLLESGAGEQVAREHLGAEAVERLVGVEVLHQPVAPDPLERVAVLLEAVAVRVTRGVEPGEGHAFAVVRRGHQTIDLLLVSVGALVGEEGGGLFGRGRQTGQVERQATEQRGLRGFGGKGQTGLGEFRDDEGIDGMLLAVTRQGGADRRHEGPVLFVFRALGDPSLENLLLRGGQRTVRIRRRHHLVGVGRRQTFDELARSGVAGHEGFLLQRGVADVEAQLGLALVAVRAVAVETVLGQNRTDVLVVIHLGAEGGQGGEERGEEGADPGHGEILTGEARPRNGRGRWAGCRILPSGDLQTALATDGFNHRLNLLGRRVESRYNSLETDNPPCFGVAGKAGAGVIPMSAPSGPLYPRRMGQGLRLGLAEFRGHHAAVGRV